MRTASTTCHGLTTPLFVVLLAIFCCESNLEHSPSQDARWLRWIERRWEGNLGGREFALTFCEDRRAIEHSRHLEDGCEIDHLVSSDWKGGSEGSTARGCGGCELDVIALVNTLVTTADGRTHAIIDGQLTLGTARDSDLSDNDFAFGCRAFATPSDWDDELAAAAESDGIIGEGAAPGCELLSSIEILPNRALSIRGEVLRALGYGSVNVPLLHLSPSESASEACAALR